MYIEDLSNPKLEEAVRSFKPIFANPDSLDILKKIQQYKKLKGNKGVEDWQKEQMAELICSLIGKYQLLYFLTGQGPTRF